MRKVSTMVVTFKIGARPKSEEMFYDQVVSFTSMNVTFSVFLEPRAVTSSENRKSKTRENTSGCSFPLNSDRHFISE